MKGYNRKLAKKIQRLYKLAEEVQKKLASAHNPLVRDFNYILNNFLALDSIGSFPEDTYNVVLAYNSIVNLGKVSKNSKRCVVIDNRDGKVTYDKEDGFLCNKGDLARNSFAVSMSLLFETYEENNFFDKMPIEAMQQISEMQQILDEWRCFADKYTHFKLEQNIKSLEENTEYFESFLKSEFNTEIERKRAKNEQRKDRGELYEKFLKIRKDFKSNQAVYVHFAELKLADEINQLKEMEKTINYFECNKLKINLNKKIKTFADTIKKAIDRAKKDKEQK
jgi:hypothetical protein